MATAGYSCTPLAKKIGIREGMKLLLINPPVDYAQMLEADISKQRCSKKEVPGLVHLFAKDVAAFEKGMKKALEIAAINDSVMIWVSWYKKSSGVKTDLDENIIRNYALANGLVDIKVCAVSELWSGLKLVVPVAKRK